MARRTLNFTATDGRDAGKVFLLREMPASQAERWAVKAFLAMSRNGLDLPEDAMDAGWAGIARIGVSMIGRMHSEDALPLLDEMMTCVLRVPSPDRPDIARPLVEDDLEEVATRVKIRIEVFKLHADFSSAAASSTSAPAAAATRKA